MSCTHFGYHVEIKGLAGTTGSYHIITEIVDRDIIDEYVEYCSLTADTFQSSYVLMC